MVAVLGLVILYINITLFAIFVVTVSAIAYQNMVSMSAITVFVVVLWMYLPAIYVSCRHLLLGYVIAIVPITAAAFVIEGYITIPSYPWLWAILIFSQACSFLSQDTGVFEGFMLFLGAMPTIFVFVIFECIAFLAMVYPWVVSKNYTLRWRRLLLYGGQSYRTILLCFAWLFQARPLYIAFFFICLCIMSKLAITSPMKRQLDPLEILRDMRQGGNTINVPIPHVIFLSLCNIFMGASIWRMVLSGFTISAWYFKCNFQENYCKAISPALTIILAWECS